MEKNEKRTKGRGRWFLMPLLLACPMAAGLIYVWIRYGQTLSDLLLAACKVVVTR